MNPDYTEQYGNIGLRVAFCDSENKAKYLKLISETFAGEPCTTQIFEGSRTNSYWTICKSWYHTNRYFTCAYSHGNTIKVADPFEIVVGRKRKHNLLFVVQMREWQIIS